MAAAQAWVEEIHDIALLQTQGRHGGQDARDKEGAVGTWVPKLRRRQRVDYYHACEHLKNGCDAAWGESTQQSRDYFERLKTRLKESADGAERVIRTLRFQCSLASSNRRKRLEAELTYFRNQQARMHYWPLTIISFESCTHMTLSK